MNEANGRVAPPLVGAEWRELTRPSLYLLLGLALLLITLGYQLRSGARLGIDVGTDEDRFYLSGFNDGEVNGKLSFRWSQDVSLMVVPGVGRNQNLDLTLGLVGSRPAGQPAAVLTVTADSTIVAVLTPPPGPQTYTVTIPASVNSADDLTIYFAANAFSPPHDRRVLGVVFDRVQLSQPANDGLAWPPISTTLWLLFSLLLLYFTLRHLVVPWQGSWALGAALMLLVAAVLAFDRYDLTSFALPLLVVMLCVYGMALLLPPLVAWTLTRLGAGPSAIALRWLMLLYLLAFAIKAGGMMHPRFEALDHTFRAHQVQYLVSNPAGFWDTYQRVTTADASGGSHGSDYSMLGQWHLQVPLPYPPLAYYIFVPFGLLWPTAHVDRLVIACDTMLAALACTVAFALYAIAKRGLGSGRAGIIAAAITLFAPVSYLHFSDGNWPYIWGGWLAVVYIMAAVCLADRASKPLPFAILSLLAALTLASHTAIALFIVALVVLAAIILLLMRRGGYGFPLWPLLASFVVGAILSLVYYGAYVWPLLTVALPAIIGHLGSGLGQDPRFLSVPLLTGFWPQVWAHFTVWPLILAAAGLILLVAHERTNEDGVHRFGLAVIIAWAGVFVIFSLADLKVNLLQRHMLFALPLLGLLAGYALVRLAQALPTTLAGRSGVAIALGKRQWLIWTLGGGLFGFLFVVGWDDWIARILRYVLPPGTG